MQIITFTSQDIKWVHYMYILWVLFLEKVFGL